MNTSITKHKKGIFALSNGTESDMEKGLRIGLRMHEYFEIIRQKGVEPHEILEAIEKGQSLEQFINKTSTGEDVLIINNFNELWQKAKELYKQQV